MPPPSRRAGAARKSLADELIETDDRIDLTPMLDCVFVILLFLIIATTFEEDGLFKVQLPKASHASVRTAGEVAVLTIARNGQYAIGRDFVPDSRLLPTLKTLAAGGKVRTLVIKGDRDCPYAKVVQAVDSAQAVNLAEFSFVVAKPE